MIKKQVVLSLGAGGAKGVAHVGVLRFLKENQIPIKAVAGSSIGSFIAALYAFNYTIDQISEIFQELDPFEYKGLNIIRLNKMGIWKNTSLENILRREFKDKNIEDSPIPLYILSTDVSTGEGIYLTKGSVVKAVMASCAVPGIYEPEEIGDRLLVDGGLVEVVPYSCFKNTDIIIASNLNTKKYTKPENTMGVINNSMDIALDNKTYEQLKNVDWVIDIDCTDYSKFKIERIDQLIKKGYEASSRLKSYRWIKFIFYRNRIIRFFKSFNFIKLPKIFK